MTCTCSNCRFYAHLTSECHLNPPHIAFIGNSAKGPMFATGWPVIPDSAWCGKFEQDDGRSTIKDAPIKLEDC